MSKKRPYDNITGDMLKAAGWEVKFDHIRRFVRPEVVVFKQKSSMRKDPLFGLDDAEKESLFGTKLVPGGATICHISPAGSQTGYTGVARCRDTDTYDYGFGSRIALRKALHNFWKANPSNASETLIEIRELYTPRPIETRQLFVLSTSHISKKTFLLTSAGASEFRYYLARIPHGAFSFVYSERPSDGRFPDDLWACHDWVNKHARRSSPEEAIYLMFDEDGPVVTGLKTYAW